MCFSVVGTLLSWYSRNPFHWCSRWYPARTSFQELQSIKGTVIGRELEWEALRKARVESLDPIEEDDADDDEFGAEVEGRLGEWNLAFVVDFL